MGSGNRTPTPGLSCSAEHCWFAGPFQTVYPVRSPAARPLLSMVEMMGRCRARCRSHEFQLLSVRNIAMKRFSIPMIAASVVCSLTYALASTSPAASLSKQTTACSCVECKCPDCNGSECSCPVCDCVGCGCSSESTATAVSLAAPLCCSGLAQATASAACNCSTESCTAACCAASDCAGGACNVE